MINVTGILNDVQIAELCKSNRPMISPFNMGKVKSIAEGGISRKIISYGCSEYGYDVRMGNRFMRINPEYNSDVLDPKNAISEQWSVFETSVPIILTPGEIIMVETAETFDMPSNVVAIVTDKSTYSRLGLLTPSAVFEPGWRGTPTICLHNASNNPIKIYPGEGFAQVLFFMGYEPHQGYGDGKYQDQQGLTLSKI